MNVTKEINRINSEEQRRGYGLDSSWHNDYKDTSWIFIGNLAYKLNEGDVLAVFSQYGEIEDVHLIRDDESGKSKGFAFMKYEDWKSTVLAVDNFNGTVLLQRTLRVDHARYERPKLKKEEEEKLTVLDKLNLQKPGHAYATEGRHKIEVKGSFDLNHGQNIFDAGARLRIEKGEKTKKRKKERKHKKGKKHKSKKSS